MSIDFDNVFSKNKNHSVPKAILNELNKNLKSGLHYIDNHGKCQLSAETFHVKGFKIKIDSNMREYFKGMKSISGDDIYEYSYNTGKPVEIIPENDRSININDNDIPIGNFIIDPVDIHKHDNSSVKRMLIYAEKENDKADLTIEDEHYKKKLVLYHKFNNQRNVYIYETDKDEIFHVIVKIDKSDHDKCQTANY